MKSPTRGRVNGQIFLRGDIFRGIGGRMDERNERNGRAEFGRYGFGKL